jgi:hypothetical protein
VHNNLREGLNNSRFRLTCTQNIGNLTDHCLKVSINQTFLSIRAAPTRSRENQALSRCSRFHTTVILARRYRRPLYKEPA